VKSILKITATNWVHVAGFLVTTYLSLILFKLLGIGDGYEWRQLIFLGILSVPFLFITFGLPILAGFYLVLVAFDFLAFKAIKLKTKRILQLEWFLIIIPFIYWAFLYEYWLWITLSVSFYFTQILRIDMINKIQGINLNEESIAQ
jgi:hypothetical protein